MNERLDMSVKVAGQRTRGQWLDLTTRLRTPNASDTDWTEAWAFFQDRVESRYLAPIRLVLGMGLNQGEGFAATALQCMLMEFLQSSYEGLLYVERPKGQEAPTPGTYWSSAPLFKAFLRQKEFGGQFSGEKLNDFYYGVRCKLLHETKTHKRWLIRARSQVDPSLVAEKQGDSFVLYRTALQDVLERFLERYRQEVCAERDAARRVALLYRLDALFDVAESAPLLES